MQKQSNKVGAVIVTFASNIEELDKLLSNLVTQVTMIVIVDNGAKTKFELLGEIVSNKNICIIKSELNQGVGSAQNIGIEILRQHGCEYLLLLDDDSSPSSGMVDELVDVLKKQQSLGLNVGAVGPFHYGEDEKISPFYRIEKCRFIRQPVRTSDVAKRVDFLIASGTLIPLPVLEDVGGMREDFFIDYVDIEWSYRAAEKGYLLYGAPRAKMRHQIGDQNEIIFGRTTSTPNYSRQYYFSRNAVNLYLYSKLPLKWKVADFLRLIKMTIILIMFAKNDVNYIKAFVTGAFHGVIKRLGPIQR